MPSPIVNPTSNGYVPVETISALVERVNDMNTFLMDIGYGNSGGAILMDTQNMGSGWTRTPRGADEFRVLTVRRKVALRATVAQPNVVIPLAQVVSPRLGGPLSYDTIVLTPVAPTPETRAIDIGLMIVAQTNESVTININLSAKPAKATYFIINMIAIATEPLQGF